MKPFRNNHPRRTCAKKKSHYRSFKKELSDDFFNRCGYTDSPDFWWGGPSGFHIDHFIPKEPKISDPAQLSKFKAVEHNYSNLIYACPQINRAKGNDWPSDDPSISVLNDMGYLDPCEIDFNDYFERTNSGGIRPKEHSIAKYMWKKLQMYLMRYELYWRIEQLQIRLDKLEANRQKFSNIPEIRCEILESIADLVREYQSYFRYLNVEYKKN